MADKNKCQDKSRIISETENQVVIDVGDENKLKATYMQIGTVKFVVIDWFRPLWSASHDSMFFWKSVHCRGWMIESIASWTEEYQKEGILTFFKDYPEFVRLFSKSESFREEGDK